jgi:hypothetical protein
MIFGHQAKGATSVVFFCVADALKPQVVKQYSLDERTSAHDAIDAFELKHRCSND